MIQIKSSHAAPQLAVQAQCAPASSAISCGGVQLALQPAHHDSGSDRILQHRRRLQPDNGSRTAEACLISNAQLLAQERLAAADDRCDRQIGDRSVMTVPARRKDDASSHRWMPWGAVMNEIMVDSDHRAVVFIAQPLENCFVPGSANGRGADRHQKALPGVAPRQA